MKKVAALFLCALLLLSIHITASAEEWVCGSCGSTVSGNFCNNCGAAKPTEGWNCPECGNVASGNYCSSCGSPKPVDDAKPEGESVVTEDTDTTYPTLQKNDYSSDVMRLNERLYEMKYLKSTPIRLYGEKTEEAVKAFQEATGLPVTGIADEQTQLLLFEFDIPDQVKTEAEPQATTTTLAKGSKGEDVVALQTRLFDLGFYNISIDGDYGNGTVNALKEFEEFNGLEPTGIATPELQAFLFSDNAQAKPVPVSSIKVTSNNPTALVGATLDLAEIVAVNPENATEKGLVYAIDSEEFATIDKNGIMTAKERGEVSVTVTSKEAVDNPKNLTFKVKVQMPTKTLALNETNIGLRKGQSYQLVATVGPENADDKSVIWTSDNPEIAAISPKGSITAKSCGECDIVCTTNDGSGVTAVCHVTITQLATSLKLSDSKITLQKSKTREIVATVSPEDTTNRAVVWSSSDSSVAAVNSAGLITAKRSGDCEITCSTADGSEKRATVKVHVPTFSVDKTEYTVTSKSGLTIPINWDSYCTISWSYDSSCFDCVWPGDDLQIDPIRAGSGTITLSNEEVPQDRITLKITIDHNAVYDSTSYPKASYEDVLRYPNDHKGDNCSIYGKVLQKSDGGGNIVLRVGTGGYGYYDKVFWIEYNTSSVKASVIEDDYITVYGQCTGAKTYETIMGSSVTIPSIKAEKIIIGRK